MSIYKNILTNTPFNLLFIYFFMKIIVVYTCKAVNEEVGMNGFDSLKKKLSSF